MTTPSDPSSSRPGAARRWLLIQLHRAQIARLLRSKKGRGTPEISRRMDAIALLCDCGRTTTGQMLAKTLAESDSSGLYSMPGDWSTLGEPS
jgi:hypothetical protein